MSAATPFVTLATGQKMPCFGFGTWQLAGDVADEMVYLAIAKGCRHIDAASIYRNEEAVGRAIARAIKDGLCTREELFVTTKVWNTDHAPDAVVPACRASLQRLGLDYVDLYLVHWPTNWQPSATPLVPAKTESGAIALYPCSLAETWSGMEQVVEAGLARAVGVSNYSAAQLKQVWDSVQKHYPVMNQVESHPYFNQVALEAEMAEVTGRDADGKGKVAITAYSPFNANPSDDGQPPLDLFGNAAVQAVAAKHGCTPAQVAIRFHIELGRGVIPRTSNPVRVQQNLDALKLKLDEDDMKSLLAVTPQRRSLNPYSFDGEVGKPFFRDE